MALSEYNGPLSDRVWKFLDEYRAASISIREDIGYLDAPRVEQKGIAKECREYVYHLMAENLSAEERDKIELDFVIEMRKKYPHVTWSCGRKENKGK